MTDEFLQKYKELEQLIIETYPTDDGTSALWALGNVKEFIPFRPQLNAIREIRNFLTHQPMVDSEYLVIPSASAIKIIDNIITKIEGPKNIYGLCIKPSEIFSAKIDDQVAPVLKLMKDRSFQVLPILDKGRVEGIFFDSAAFLREIGEGILATDTTFFKLKKYIDPAAHIGKDILFLPKNSAIENVKEIINECFQNGNRIAAVFVTENGRVTESLLGMILPLQLI